MAYARPPHSIASRQRVLSIAGLAASLMLGACAQTSDLLPGANMTLADGGDGAQNTNDVDRTELQKATAYWGGEYAKKPGDLNAALSYARNLKALGERQQALMVLQQASGANPDSAELAGEYGRLALELDQVSVAGKMLALADNPSKPDWRVISARGTVFAKQGQYKQAIPFYERALMLSPSQPSVLNNLAMAHAMSGDAKKAEDLLRQAEVAGASSPKVRQNLALVLGLQGRYDESKVVASKDLPQDTASANSDYLKRMVKLDAKAAPQPAATKTATAAASPIAKSGDAFKPAAIENTAASTPADWSTAIAASSPADGGPQFKGSKR
ncbi:MAG: tetratricopeptide repeat protein [Hyphomicrobium sp.]